MNNNVIFVRGHKDDIGIDEFFKMLYKTDISRDFLCARLDVHSIRDILREHISEHGISSLFRFSLTCDAILHNGIHVDEIERVILGFVQKLDGTKHLLIVDPFLYTDDPACLGLFERMMSRVSTRLQHVTIITNGRRTQLSGAMHGILRNLVPAVKIHDIATDEFHDRYWIDVDGGRGIVMGTSLNGIGKKIALIDCLDPGDVREIVSLAKPLM